MRLFLCFFVWEQRKLGELFKIKSGQTPSSHNEKNYYPPQIHWIRTGDLTNSKIVNTEKLLSQKGAQKLTLFPKNTVVIAMYGGFNQIGRTGLLTFPSTINQALAAMTPNPVINPNFLLQLLNKHIYDWRRLAASSRKDPNITKKDIENQKLDFTSLLEQKKISKLIFLTDKIISLQQRKLKQLNWLKIGFSQFFFNPKILNKAPQFKLNTLGKTYSGLTGKTKADFGHGNATYITYLNVNQNEVADPSQVEAVEIDKKQNMVQKGDILFTISSETPEEVGLTSIWPISRKNLYLNSFCFGFRVNHPEEIDPFYLGYLFRSSYFRGKIFPLAQGISRFNLSRKNTLKITIGVNSKKIQMQVTSIMKNVDSMIKNQEQKIDHLKSIKQFLLQNMFI